MPLPDLSPGSHTFYSATKNLTFEYIIHTTPSHPDNHHNELLIIHPPAWGLGSEYLQTGLLPLLKSSTKTTYTLLFFHPRGTNNSSRPSSQSQMSTFELATDLEDLRLHLDLERLPTLLGHSNGGAIALAYAEIYPSRVARLILLDSQVLGMKTVQKLTHKESNANRNSEETNDKDPQSDSGPDSDEKIFETLRKDPRYARILNSTNGLDKSSDEAFTASVNAKWALYFSDPGKYVPELRAAIGDRVMPLWCYLGVYGSDRGYEESGEMVRRLGDVKAKTLMLNGREDWICRAGDAERTRVRIPGARLVVCEECGHFPWIEARERTMREIVGFIGDCT